MATWMVRAQDLPAFLSTGAFSERFVSVGSANGLRFVRLNGAASTLIDLTSPRGAMSIKSFCFPPRECVACYSQDEVSQTSSAVMQPRLIAGVRPCELRALQYIDRVFGSPPEPDPFYQKRRENLLIVSVDCVKPHETCFCTLVGGSPYADEGADIQLTPLGDGFLVEAHTPAGEAFVTDARRHLREATAEDVSERDRVRRAACEELETRNAACAPSGWSDRQFAGITEDAIPSEIAGACVECGACTQICPTCHCFYLLDRAAEASTFERHRSWDSCVWSGYSRMAGAPSMKPNPRAAFRSRFANRFLHKYVWSPQQWELLGCVGCGRCSECCPGDIDMRKVVVEASP
jgi:sulfhydrogenase subunit beta (sulfur reductase)